MKCPSGKRSYHSKHDAEEALIGARINFYHDDSSGPINVYECSDCNEWHLTSRGPMHELLDSNEIKNRIRLERESQEWERRLR